MKLEGVEISTMRQLADFVRSLPEIYNQEKRAEALIRGIVRMVGEKAAESFMYGSITVRAFAPFLCSFNVVIKEGSEEIEIAEVSFYQRALSSPAGTEYCVEAASLFGQSVEDKVSIDFLVKGVGIALVQVLQPWFPGLRKSYSEVYGPTGDISDRELDPELFTIGPKSGKQRLISELAVQTAD